MCSFGMKDPNGYYYYKPTSLLRNFGDENLAPVFKRCINKLGGDKYHYHQQLEGNAPGHGSRTKLAQVYPYRFCSTLIRSILPSGRHYGLFHAQTTLLVDLLDDLTFEETKSLSAHVNFELPQEFVHYSSLASKSAVPVKDHFVKRLMNQINALAAGYEYNPCHLGLGHEVVSLRDHFSPYMSFDNATILHGTFEPLRVRYRQTSGLLFLWRKKDVRQLHVLSHPNVDLSNLMPSQWSCILLWNSDGRIPVEHRTDEDVIMLPADQPPDYPPGLPPDSGITSSDFPMIPDDQPDPPTYFPHDPPDNPMSGPHYPSDGPPQPPHVPMPGPSHHPPSDPPAPPSAVSQFQPSYFQPVSVQPDTPVLPSLVIPPHIEDTPMTHSTKRPAEPPPDSPSRPVTKARPSQMPAAIPPAVSPSNHLGGDVSLDFQPASSSTPQQPSQTPQTVEQQVASGGTKKKKPDQQEEEDDDRQDPDASASGPNLPLAEPSEPEEEEDSNETDENTTPAQTEDSDETIDYGDLYVDDSQWSWLSMEQKLCSNTGSFTVPRYIDGSPVNIKETPSHADFVTSYSVIAERKRESFRRNFSDIKEVYSGITEEDKAYLTLFQSEDKFAHLVGKKRKEATQQERRQLAKQFLEAKQAEVKSWFDNDVFELVDMRKLKIRNFVTGRWVLTVKKDKDGKFLKCKARWVLKGFQDKQKDTQQTDSLPRVAQVFVVLPSLLRIKVGTFTTWT